MNWYYVEAGQQAGPVNDAQLAELVSSGKIASETMVWREGMANWQPYREVSPGAAPIATPTLTMAAPATPTGEEAACAECGRIFHKQDMITYGTVKVCAACKPVFLQKLAEGAQLQTGEFRYAGFWIRFCAKFVDGLILGVVFIIPLFIIGFRQAFSGQPPTMRMQLVQLGLQILYLLANMAYIIFFLGKYGATPGKMACKIHVVTADGGKISYGRATGRFFAELLSGIVCYIGYIIAGFDQQKRALHDHICNTRVVYK
jgi:uncharacterized RDD family membrane protein YckC